MTSLKIPKRVIGKVNRRRTDNTMKKKRKTMVYSNIHYCIRSFLTCDQFISIHYRTSCETIEVPIIFIGILTSPVQVDGFIFYLLRVNLINVLDEIENPSESQLMNDEFVLRFLYLFCNPRSRVFLFIL